MSAELPTRDVTMANRAVVADIADCLIDGGLGGFAASLIDAVRCCGEFPECSHVLAFVEALDSGGVSG